MARIVLLDTAPLGLICHPRAGDGIRAWIGRLDETEMILGVPEIADYEVRRELTRLGSLESLRRLDFQKARLYYLPITTEAMMIAAELWAMARRAGRPGADRNALDGDVIIAAQARLLINQGHEVVVATDNRNHFEMFVNARRWQDIG